MKGTYSHSLRFIPKNPDRGLMSMTAAVWHGIAANRVNDFPTHDQAADRCGRLADRDRPGIDPHSDPLLFTAR
jgi:hypothetical protein